MSLVCALTGIARADDAPTFEKHVAPFLRTYCVGCHDGGDDSQGGLSVLTHQSLMAGGDGGEVIAAGQSGESRLVRMLRGTAKPKMPPPDSKQPPAEEIELVARWIDAGARSPSSSAPTSAADLSLRRIAPRSAVAPAVAAVAFSGDGRFLAAARHRDVLLLDAASGALVQTLSGADSPLNAVAFSPDSRTVAAAEGLPGVVGKARLWSLGEASDAAPRTLTGHTDSIYAVAFSPDGGQLVTASYDKLLILWDASTGTEKHTLKHHTGAVFAAAFSPDGSALASVAADQTVKLWNAATGQRILTLIEPTKGLSSVAFHPRGTELAAAGADRMIRLYDWNSTAARLRRSAFAHDGPILALAYSPDGGTLYSSGEDRRIKAWDAAQLRERHLYDGLADWPLAIALHPAGDRLAAGLFDGSLALYDSRSPAKIHDVSLPLSRQTALLAPPADTLLAAAVAPPVATAEATSPVAVRSDAAQPEPPEPNPPAPRFDAITPRTVVRGQKVRLTLHGQNVSAADRLFVSHSTLKPVLLPSDEKNPNAAFCEIEIPTDLPPGAVALRLHTPLGTAGAKSFFIGPFAETAEKEDNGLPDRATPITLPATLTGVIAARGDRDLWSFDAREGEELVFVLFGPQLGSSIQARLTLLDGRGEALARAAKHAARGEVVLGHRFTVAGRYSLRVEDRDNTGGGNHFYWVQAGAYPYVAASFPLGMRAADVGERAAGEVATIELSGFNLAPRTRLTPVPGVTTRSVTPHAPGGPALNAARYEASPHAEFAEVEPNDEPRAAALLPSPVGVSGTLSLGDGSPAGDVDCFLFDARRGERLTIETFARRLGSSADTAIDILDAEGHPVPRATLRAVAETYSVLRDHESRTKGIRLQAWDDLVPNDYVLIGDEVLKVQALPLGPDADVAFFDRFGPRMGQLGTTPQAHAINTAAYKVEVHPPGAAFPPNGMPVVPLEWSSDDAPGLGSDSQVLFDVPADGRYAVRVRDVRGAGGDESFYRLTIRPRREDFRISIDPENPNIPRGGSLPITVSVDRLEGFNGSVEVRVEGLPEGLTATTTRIGPDLFTGILTLTATEQAQPALADLRLRNADCDAVSGQSAPASTPAATALSMRVIARATINGQTVERATTPGFGSHHVTITSPPDLAVAVEPSFAEIVPGQEVRFTATIERRNAFAGRVPVDVLNLPHGLRVLDVGLNGVLINEDETSRSFVVTCDPWAESGPVTFYAAARVEAKNERHAGPPLRLEVRNDSK